MSEQQQDVNLSGTPAQDVNAELARLREENARLQAKRDNDERSAFGRLEHEANLRRQRETELADMRKKMAELEQKNFMASLPPEATETLGEKGIVGVKAMIDKSLAGSVSASEELAAIKQRLEQTEKTQQAFIARQSYNANLMSWANQVGAAGLLPRLGPSGDLKDKWAGFAQQYPGAVEAYERGDVEATKAYVKLFMHENPGLSQQTATPSASGGFAPPADSSVYGSQQWLAEVNELERQLDTGQITRADHAKGFAAANAKLAASQKRG